MKNLRRFEVKNLINGALFGLLLVTMLVAGVGCSNRNNGNNAFNPNGNWGGGFGPGGFQPGFGPGPRGVGYDFDGNEVYMEFGQAQQGGFGFQDPYFYTGQVTLAGGINMQGLQCMNMGAGYVPGGQYQFQSMQPVMSQNGIVSGAQLRAFGPAQLTITLGFAHIQSPTGGTNFQVEGPLTATLTVQAINGMPCGAMMAIQPGNF